MRMLPGLLTAMAVAFSTPSLAASSFITIQAEQAADTPSIVSVDTPPGLDRQGVAAIPADRRHMAPRVIRAGEVGTSTPLQPAAATAARSDVGKAAAPEPPSPPTQQPR